MSELPEPLAALDFPESDGAPMGESGDHIEAIIDLHRPLLVTPR